MSRHIIHYNQKLKQLAKELRNKSTLSEVLLWQYLKGKKIKGFRFHRQKPIGNYIVDFFCNDLMLAIEIDGSSHGDKIVKDFKRQRDLESLNIKFLRFKDSDVKNNIDGVLEAIYKWVDGSANRINTPPTPSLEGTFKI